MWLDNKTLALEISLVRLFNHYFPSKTLYQVGVELCLLFAAISAAMALHGSALPEALPLPQLAVLGAIFAATMTLLISLVGLYHPERQRNIMDVAARVLLAFGIGLPAIYFLVNFVPCGETCRDALDLTTVLALGSILAHRAVVFHAEDVEAFAKRVLIVGVGPEALTVSESLGRARDTGFSVVGFYQADAPDGVAVPAGRVISSRESLHDVAKRLAVNEVIVAVRERRGGVLPLRELLECKLRGIHVTDLSSFYERTRGQIRVDSLKASWLIYGDGFRQGFMRNLIKRASDVLASTILLIATLPVMVLTAIAIAIENGFPIIYRQQRVGQGGRVFDVLKFRSMRKDAEADGKPRWANANDDRITRVGRFIRRTRIDELPQIFNVLKGDMSFVGPRPERPFFVEKLTNEIPFYAVRHSVKPGITGWAQVSYAYGATVDDAVQKLQYDLYYVKNHTLFLDSLILFKTVRVVLTGDGAR
jgi:sugar transferase (PEP-CTERM system associated)